MKAHDGELLVDTSPERGTTFYAILPADGDVDAAESETPAPQLTVPFGDDVLLVEDDETIAGGLLALLESDGVAVEWVTTAAAAIERVSRSRPSLIILDVRLPDMDAPALYERELQHLDIPVIFSSGDVDEAAIAAVRSDRVGILIKPYTYDRLLAEMHRLGDGGTES